jgi:predicted metal-dependent phosphoesterase TrpH
MRADLHLHSTASDGELGPGEVIGLAAAGGLTLVALTDHDSASGVSEAQEAASPLGLTVLPGTELSSTRAGREIHILGYGIDPDHPAIRRRGARARERRRERMAAMVGHLSEQGIELSLGEVEAAAGRASLSMLGRPHLARALVAAGHVTTVEEAFDRWIGDRHRAFVPTDLGSPEDAVATIREAGGVAVWAHPPWELLSTWLDDLADAGLQGVEAYRASWSPGRCRRVARAARGRGLCTTGGSDWHGPTKGGRLGDFWLPEERIADLLDRLGR